MPQDSAFHLVFNALQSRTAQLKSWLDPAQRDLNAECGYPDKITIHQYREMYEREGPGTRVVSVYPDECWKADPWVGETQKTRETAFERRWNELQDEHDLYYHLHELDVLSGIGRYGVMLLGLDDGGDLAQPVRDYGKAGDRDLLYLRSFDEGLVTIIDSEKSKSSPRYGLPTVYGLRLADPETGVLPESVSPTPVHWHRVIHAAEDAVNPVFGRPRMRPVFNRLMDLRKLLGGSAEMFWKGAFPGFFFNIDPLGAGGLTDEEKQAMRDEFQAYTDRLQRYMAGTGTEVTELRPQVADPSPHVLAQLQIICLTIGCPLRTFMGSEQAHLASTQDKETWNARLMRRMNRYLTPRLIRPFARRLSDLGVAPTPRQLLVEWPDLNKMSDEAKSKVAVTWTTALSNYVRWKLYEVMSPVDYLTDIFGMDRARAEELIKQAVAYTKKRQREEDKRAEAQAAKLAEQAPQNPGNNPGPAGPPQDDPRRNGQRPGRSNGRTLPSARRTTG